VELPEKGDIDIDHLSDFLTRTGAGDYDLARPTAVRANRTFRSICLTGQLERFDFLKLYGGPPERLYERAPLRLS
jgi:hypothetical protein